MEKENKVALEIVSELVLLARHITTQVEVQHVHYSRNQLLQVNTFLFTVMDAIHNLPTLVLTDDTNMIQEEYKHVKKLHETAKEIDFLHDFSTIWLILDRCIQKIESK